MNILILIAGYPGTGKTYMANKVIEKHPDIVMISQDLIKEKFWDKFGFNNLCEKNKLIELARKEFFLDLEDAMKDGENIISDYPFGNKQKDMLKNMAIKFNYKVVTLRLIGNIDVLFGRQAQRDLLPSRHYGHISTNYHKEIKIEDRSKSDSLLEFSEFKNRCLNRGYGDFELGSLCEIDVSCYDKIDYKEINNFIDNKMEGKK